MALLGSGGSGGCKTKDARRGGNQSANNETGSDSSGPSNARLPKPVLPFAASRGAGSAGNTAKPQSAVMVCETFRRSPSRIQLTLRRHFSRDKGTGGQRQVRFCIRKEDRGGGGASVFFTIDPRSRSPTRRRMSAAPTDATPATGDNLRQDPFADERPPPKLVVPVYGREFLVFDPSAPPSQMRPLKKSDFYRYSPKTNPAHLAVEASHPGGSNEAEASEVPAVCAKAASSAEQAEDAAVAEAAARAAQAARSKSPAAVDPK